jgi:hypothetical protein
MIYVRILDVFGWLNSYPWNLMRRYRDVTKNHGVITNTCNGILHGNMTEYTTRLMMFILVGLTKYVMCIGTMNGEYSGI